MSKLIIMLLLIVLNGLGFIETYENNIYIDILDVKTQEILYTVKDSKKIKEIDGLFDNDDFQKIDDDEELNPVYEYIVYEKKGDSDSYIPVLKVTTHEENYITYTINSDSLKTNTPNFSSSQVYKIETKDKEFLNDLSRYR